MRRLFIIGLLFGQLFSQSLIQKLAAPVFYELGLEPNFQSNPLNLSDSEILKASQDSDYLNGIEYSSSNVISFSGELSYAPRLFAGRKSSFNLSLDHHYYHDIPERSYQSYSLSLKQSLGKYRYLDLGYWILPEYYLRNYRLQDTHTLITRREVCNFGTDRLWLGFEHRLTRKNSIEYRLALRNELYQAPFSHYDLRMLEGDLKLNLGQFDYFSLYTELQYGVAENDNNYDDKDRSYTYLNIRPTLIVKLPGKHRIRLATRYEQRAYGSEQYDDLLHAGRYQDEVRIDLTLLPHVDGPFAIEPYLGYRERRVDSSDPAVRELKSFQRYWFGIRFGFDSVIDMYF
ncbi:MAG: hypothetical protein K9M55_03415 [Candidatus Marinimicrobia bacterium]|nr:hypothetical protein [Candidatus Neomarinimicrobiota bacterium]MCF7921727.1 hypothetical protein [Candidatus Neomarinimicrobiota bacterium]